MKENTLFGREVLRDSRGRFCTAERQFYEKVASENDTLRYECEKWKRAYIALSRDNSRLTRELEELKAKVRDIV